MLLELLVDKFDICASSFWLGGPFAGCICTGIGCRKIREIYDKKMQLFLKELTKWLAVIIASFLITFISRGTVCTFEIIVIVPIIFLAIDKKLSVLDNVFLCLIGEASFVIYLIHQNIGFIIQLIFIDLFGEYTLLIPTFTMLLVIGLGFSLHYLIEKPIQKAISRKENT